jgi:Protein of unknown function (DUF2946)
MRRRLFQRVGSYLGLLAILMMTLAPAISHALADSHQAALHAHTGCPEHDSADDTPAMDDASHAPALHWHACGYCGLAAHLPMLPSVEPSFALTVWSIRHRVATTFESIARTEPRSSAQPRAPPVSS